MSEQDLFAAETAEEVREAAARFDAVHHTEEQLPGSFAAKAVIREDGSPSRSAGQPAAAAAGSADEAAPVHPAAAPMPAKAEGPAPAGSPLDPGVGPVSGCRAAHNGY